MRAANGSELRSFQVVGLRVDGRGGFRVGALTSTARERLAKANVVMARRSRPIE